MHTRERYNSLGTFAAIWAIIGFTLLILTALIRLTPIALEALQHPLTPLQWTVLIANTLFMLYAEGYKGFQKKFSPRAAARARYLATNTRPIDALLAPCFIMCYYAAPRRRIIASWILTLFIIAFIILIRVFCQQPWRGILDTGVVLGLSYGLTTFLYFVARAFAPNPKVADPEVQLPNA